MKYEIHDGLSRQTLVMWIKKFTDGWCGYNNLINKGYVHERVNDTTNFVFANYLSVHTNNIERLWMDLL